MLKVTLKDGDIVLVNPTQILTVSKHQKENEDDTINSVILFSNNGTLSVRESVDVIYEDTE